VRRIPAEKIARAVEELCFTAAYHLPGDVRDSLAAAAERELSPLGSSILSRLLENAEIASKKRLPICQDTGFAVFFIEIGKQVRITGGDLTGAITEGTRRGYKKGYLRKSIVDDPLFNRVNTGDNTPPIIHLKLQPGGRLTITLAPKGGGSENMSAVRMLTPAEGRQGVIDFVVNTVVGAGGNPCPPTIVGVGIGGTFEKAALLAKEALLRPVGEKNPDKQYAELEEEILKGINTSGVGPQGLGGVTTALAVHILSHPCHIASLPVAVNLNCHAARNASITL
jgi:fumarate hydratase subunit alpha